MTTVAMIMTNLVNIIHLITVLVTYQIDFKIFFAMPLFYSSLSVYDGRTTLIAAFRTRQTGGFFYVWILRTCFKQVCHLLVYDGLIAVNTIPLAGNSSSRLLAVVETRPPHNCGYIQLN